MEYIFKKTNHDEKPWLLESIEITTYLISYIIILLVITDPVPMGLKNSPLMKEFTQNKERMNSKGHVISQIQHPIVKWIAIIVSICLTISRKHMFH